MMRMIIDHALTSSFLCLGFFLLVASESLDEEASVCTEQKYCGPCIVADPRCGWCEQADYVESGNSRCDLVENLRAAGCRIENVHPRNEKSEAIVTKQKPLGSNGRVQIHPQEMNVKLRPKSPARFKIQYHQEADYPVDLYYLMDLSASMRDDKDKLATLGVELAQKMEKITRDFRLGFGSFVDKTVMPYVSTVERKLKEPCKDCAPPYGFRNDLPLTANHREFASKVKEAKVSGNLDAPEGGFDAIMQAVVCHDAINWRKRSRKLLLFSTDSEFHYAGDGKLGGIVEPNDGLCHLDANGYEYEYSTIQDYPSISQINHAVSENSVNIIFAVTEKQLPVYKRLADHIEGSRAARLARDSNNVVELIRDNYRDISSEVKMVAESDSEDVQVKFFSRCKGTELKETPICNDVGINETVEFEVELVARACPSRRRQVVKIKPVGLNEVLKVKIHSVCECDCEKEGFEEPLSPRCTAGNGTFECGQCTCHDDRYGRLCECSKTDPDLTDFEATCRKENQTEVCSGKGKCMCGLCQCDKRPNKGEIISGPFCECENFNCDRYKGELCGGADRGQCVCGKCSCEPGFTGNDCACATSNATCIASNGKLCNGYGSCVCGTCRCNTNSTYRGPTCEDCPKCKGTCKKYRDCVECRAFRGRPRSPEECHPDGECEFHMEILPDPEEVLEEGGFRRCQFKDEADDCNFFFAYRYDKENRVFIRVQEKKLCPQEIDLLAIILGVIIGIVAVGLALLLIWKLYTTISDSREFAKFEAERQNAKWDSGENPIYKEAKTTYRNPAYGGRL